MAVTELMHSCLREKK